jgi:hypothetical protein
MEPEIEFNQAAFKHGCTEADIRWAFKTFVFEVPCHEVPQAVARLYNPIGDCMAKMTEEEADALDELWTRTTPPIRRGEGGPFTRQRDLLKSLDEVSANYIMTIAADNHQTPAQVIGNLVREKIAAGV